MILTEARDVRTFVEPRPRNYAVIALILIFGEFILNELIIHRVAYTEIDWIAYMDEVRGVINGQFDYLELKGDTGPLVYPAGFVYFFGILYFITQQGTNILLAQQFFAMLYLLVASVVFYVYRLTTAIPPWLLVTLCLSKRIHSIFVLRLFNDPVAMLFLYISIALFCRQRWSLGCFCYSMAVSIKMNILLFAPGLLFLLLHTFGIKGSISKLTICASVQLVLGAPFLLTYPHSYVIRAFDFGRQFFYIWTVNWKMLPEELFLSKSWALFLLVCHVSVLLLFVKKWSTQLPVWSRKKQGIITPEMIVTVLFTSNFVGIVFARSLHFQFYVWYFHTLPFLIYRTWKFNPHYAVGLLLSAAFVAIEWCWNVFPSNPTSSSTLLICHLFILWGLLMTPAPVTVAEKKD